MDHEKLWQDSEAQRVLAGHQRIDLLKATEALTRQIFKEHEAFRAGREALGTSAAQASWDPDTGSKQTTAATVR